jgi:hypothetical protein
MTAPISDFDPSGPRAGALPEPPCPLPPELRSDVAYSRACGHAWDLIAAVFGYNPDALRRACENDPAFEPAQQRAWAAVTWEGEADGMRRLRLLANGADEDKALKAAEILVKYARERRRDDTRLACEKARAETRLAVEAARAERRASESEPGWVTPAYPAPETPDEREKRVAREHAARAAEPEAEVYLWGGKHRIGRSQLPDETDTRVRLKGDWSCGVAGPNGVVHGLIYWVVPESVCTDGRAPGIVEPLAAG